LTGITLDTSTANSATIIVDNNQSSATTTTPKYIYETVTVTDAAGYSTTKPITITINPAVIETATATSVTTTSGIATSVTIYASQGTGTKTFSRTSAVGSNAITLNTSVTNQATLNIGALTSPGTYYETITATDTLGGSKSLMITITVNGPPTISGTTGIYTTQGVTFNSPLFQAFGGNGTYTFSITSNPTAAGITVSSPVPGYARVVVSSAVASGTYNETLTVTDGLGATGISTFAIRVNAPVALSGTQTVTTTYGTAFSTGYNSSGGTGPFTFSASNVCAVSRSTFVGDGTNGTVNGTSYTVDQILGTGTCNWLSPAGVDSASVLVIAGGGAGGTRAGGGGGAGGYQYFASQALTPNTNYSIIVGAGGTGVLLDSANNGENSRFGALSEVIGGGGGGGAITSGSAARSGKDGGSGGGAAGYNSSSSAAYGLGTSGQGNNGGSAMPSNAWPGGGGGGAGGAGTTPTSNTSPAGKGGAGIANAITGTSICYATGGGGGTKLGYTAGAGGDCGGVASPNVDSGTVGSVTPANPKPNTGAGGGGSGWSDSTDLVGGNGASGVVVLRYVTPTVDASNSSISYLVSSAGSSSSAGLLTLSLPEALNAGTYSHTVKVTDSTGSVSSPVTINITVNKANPVVALSLPGSATSVQYGFGVQLSAQTSTAGTVQFKDNGTEINGCGSKSTSSFIATCRWIPTAVATRTITAVFTPTDTSNFNTGITATMSVTVTKADTLTVTSKSENFTFTNSPAAVTEAFTINGLAEIDSVTVGASSITTTYIGTANDSTSWNSTTAPTKAGSNYEIRPSALIFNTGAATNYVNIVYVSGVLSIARSSNSGTFNYSNSNALTYSLNAIDTPTVTKYGEAVPVFTGTTPEKCSIDSSTGRLSILQAGTCSVTMDVPEGYNYLTTSVVRTVTIARASRTFTLSTTSATLKYGDTLTVTSTISAGADDGQITYVSSMPNLCRYDAASAQVIGLAGAGNCSFYARIGQGTNYETSTSNTVSESMLQADAPIVSIDSVTAVDYAGGSSLEISPTLLVSGLKFSDAFSSATLTYGFVSSPAGTFTYSSTTAPTEGGTYSITPSSLQLSTGSLSNYQTPIYRAGSVVVRPVDQPTLSITNLSGDLKFPVKLIASGGAAAAPAISFAVTASTATNCRTIYGPSQSNPAVSEWTLVADSAGSCSVVASRAQNRNYKVVYSDTATITVLNFQSYSPTFVFGGSSGITLSNTTTLTKGPDACTSGCVPEITGISPSTGYIGDMLTLTGNNFTGAISITFNALIPATNFTNDPISPDTTIIVQIPVGVSVGEVGIEVVTPGGTSARNFNFDLLP
jgi:hypothetical protein